MPVKKLGAAVHHHNSAAMSALLSPTLGIRDAQRKAGLTPRDHSKDNRQIIKELSRANKGKKLDVRIAMSQSKLEELYEDPNIPPEFGTLILMINTELEKILTDIL